MKPQAIIIGLMTRVGGYAPPPVVVRSSMSSSTVLIGVGTPPSRPADEASVAVR